MAINFKPINEVPEIESLTDGDKILVNSGGEAKQIDASKVGGSGGGASVLYYQITGAGESTSPDIDASMEAALFFDDGFTKPVTYDEFDQMIKRGPYLLARENDVETEGVGMNYSIPSGTSTYSQSKTVSILLNLGKMLAEVNFTFPDSITE